jgi:hypothetical protein
VIAVQNLHDPKGSSSLVSGPNTGGDLMHTIDVMSAGFALRAVCLWVGRQRGSRAKGALVVLPLWLLATAVDMWIGVRQAGYAIAAELPIFLLLFGVPAAVALRIRRSAL